MKAVIIGRRISGVDSAVSIRTAGRGVIAGSAWGARRRDVTRRDWEGVRLICVCASECKSKRKYLAKICGASHGFIFTSDTTGATVDKLCWSGIDQVVSVSTNLPTSWRGGRGLGGLREMRCDGISKHLGISVQPDSQIDEHTAYQRSREQRSSKSQRYSKQLTK